METTALTTRVIAGALYARSATPYAFDLRVHELGHGHVEATAMPRHAWHEVAALSLEAEHDYAQCVADDAPPTRQELLDRAADNRDRATRRARTMVRRLAKAKGLSVLLTLTYRENVIDRSRMARDFDVFRKRVNRVLNPGEVAGKNLDFVCVFERQKRGAWHAHIAVPRILTHYMARGQLVRSYDLLRSIWQAVVGEFEGKTGGNIDVSRNKRVSRSTAKLAAYLSKYIGKTFDQAEKFVNSYSASGRALPAAVTERVLTTSQCDAISALVGLIRGEIDAPGIVFHQAVIDGGGYYLCLSPPDRGR